MALYLFQGTYTAESVAAQIKDPQDRIEANKSMLEAAGVKVVGAGFPLGEYGIVLLVEAPGRHRGQPRARQCCWRRVQPGQVHSAAQWPGVG